MERRLDEDGAGSHLTATPWNVGHPFLTGGAINPPAFVLTFIVQVLLRTAIDALRQKGEKTMTTLMTWTKTKLRNVPNVLADIGLNFTTTVIATISGPSVQRRGRFSCREW